MLQFCIAGEWDIADDGPRSRELDIESRPVPGHNTIKLKEVPDTVADEPCILSALTSTSIVLAEIIPSQGIAVNGLALAIFNAVTEHNPKLRIKTPARTFNVKESQPFLTQTKTLWMFEPRMSVLAAVTTKPNQRIFLAASKVERLRVNLFLRSIHAISKVSG